jgi:hypothetical protein
VSLGEEDAAFFHGREQLTCDVVERLAARTGKITMLVGNSGVGKSSVAFAGVFATLHRKSWPGEAQRNRPWPTSLADSRRWVRIAMKPGENPVTALATAFTSQWPDPKMSAVERVAVLERAAVQLEQAFKDGAGVDALVRAADTLSREQSGDVPERYVLYVDQGEQLYLERYREDVPEVETMFVEDSIAADNRRKRELQALLHQSREQVELALRRESLFLGCSERERAGSAHGSWGRGQLGRLQPGRDESGNGLRRRNGAAVGCGKRQRAGGAHGS